MQFFIFYTLFSAYSKIQIYVRRVSKSSSPQKRNSADNHTTKIDPKLGAPRKTAGVRNLPKIETRGKKKERQRKESGGNLRTVETDASSSGSGEIELSDRKSASSGIKDLDTVEEEADN